MTREHKLALVVGFSLVLVVGVLLSDHFSKARQVRAQQAAQNDPVPTPPVRYDPTPPSLPFATAQPAAQMETVDVPPPVTLPHATQPPPMIDMGSPKPTLTGDAADPGPGIRSLPLNQAGAGETLRPIGATEPPPLVKPAPDPGPTLPYSKGALKQHEIAKGDTITKIADKYYGDKALWKPLLAYNKSRVASESSMKVGLTIMIPPRDVLLGQAALPPEAKAGVPPQNAGSVTKEKDPAKPAAPEKSPKPGPTYYVVQAGDTLAKIAQKQLGDKNKWESIYDLNSEAIEDESSLSVGQKLKMPSK